MEILIVVPAVGQNVGAASGGVPDHGTSESRLALGILHELVRRLRVHVSTAGAVLGVIARKADEELGSRAGRSGNEALPVVEVEALGAGVANDVVARRVVVELDEQEVEPRLRDHLVHVKELRVERALRCSRDHLAATGGGDVLAKSVDQCDVPGLVTELDLDIKIETVHHIGAEGTRPRPAGIDRAVCAPQEVGELLTGRRGRDGIVRALNRCSSYGQQYLLPLCVAGSNPSGDGGTLILEVRLGAVVRVNLKPS